MRHNKKDIFGTSALAVMLVLLFAPVALGATINLRVETDKSTYRLGDTVSWTVYAWASATDNDGVQFLSIDIDDNTPDTIQPPFADGTTQFTDTAYGAAVGFQVYGWGTPTTVPGLSDLLGITVMQSPATPTANPNIGNDGQKNHILAKGSYVANKLGRHYLTPILVAANYWRLASGKAVAFENDTAMSAMFDVEPNADLNQDDYVDFLDLAMIAVYMERIDCGRSADCEGADLNLDGKVTLADVIIVAQQWLSCTDPANPSCIR
jgi:hypothetical protein